MTQADAVHKNRSIEAKLQRIYSLHRKEMDFRLEQSPYNLLLERLGDPHLNLPPTVHVAGTNGKGSTLAFLRGTLEAAGQRVHAYTSPHLLAFNERIVLSSEIISDSALEELLDSVWQKAEGLELTFFEFTTALAFHAYATDKADVLLLETGLGGRLDCTNIVPNPSITAITRLSFDHMEFLGNSLPQIAAEKAGIMKVGVPCIIAPQPDMNLLAPVFIEQATRVKAPLLLHGRDWHMDDYKNLLNDLPLQGAHQRQNAATALCIADHCPSLKTNKLGVHKAHWPARLEKLSTGKVFALLPKGSELWYDAAHNDSGAESLAAWLAEKRKTCDLPVHMVVGMGADKNAVQFFEALNGLYESVTLVDLPQARKPQTSLELRQKLGACANNFTIANTIEQAVLGLSVKSLVVVGGSLYLYAQVV